MNPSRTPRPEAAEAGREEIEIGRLVSRSAFAFEIYVIGAICGKQRRPRRAVRISAR